MDYQEKVRRTLFHTGSEPRPQTPPPENGDSWGSWVYNAKEPASLDFIGEPHRIGFPHQVLLSHISDREDGLLRELDYLQHQKIWFGGQVCGDFFDALHDLGVIRKAADQSYQATAARERTKAAGRHPVTA